MVGNSSFIDDLELKFSLLVGYHISCLPILLERVRSSQSILHELHKCHLTLGIDLAPDRKWARACLVKCPRTQGKAAKDCYVLSIAEQGFDLEKFIVPYGLDGCECVNDGFGPLWCGCQYLLRKRHGRGRTFGVNAREGKDLGQT